MVSKIKLCLINLNCSWYLAGLIWIFSCHPVNSCDGSTGSLSTSAVMHQLVIALPSHPLSPVLMTPTSSVTSSESGSIFAGLGDLDTGRSVSSTSTIDLGLLADLDVLMPAMPMSARASLVTSMTTEVSASSAQCLVCPSGDLLFQRYTLAQLSLLQERGQLTLPTCTNCFPDCMMREYLHQQALNQITAWSQQHVQVPAEVRGRAHPLFNYYRHNSISAVAPPRRFHVRSIIPVATKLTAVGTGVVERSIVGLKRPIATVTAGSQLMREYPSILRPRRVKARTGYWLGVKK